MRVSFTELIERTKGWIDLIDITRKVESLVKKENIQQGLAIIYAVERKTALITLEADMALILDMADLISRMLEEVGSKSRGDIAAALLGTQLAIPIVETYLDLGTWQQIMLVDLGQPGEKKVLVQIIG